MPYLFVLVFAETMVLVTCASIPALGPIVLILKMKVSSYRGHSSNDGSGDDPGGAWSNQDSTLITFGGSRWKSALKSKHGRSDGNIIDLSPVESLDKIPLARIETRSVHETQSKSATYGGEGIRKTTNISVTTEKKRVWERGNRVIQDQNCLMP